MSQEIHPTAAATRQPARFLRRTSRSRCRVMVGSLVTVGSLVAMFTAWFSAAESVDASVTAESTVGFVETFDSPSSVDRFDIAVHHPVLFGEPVSSWQGDHDAGCGGPTTTRTVQLPGNRIPGDGKTYSTDAGDAVYWCAPAGTGSGHLMTSFNTTGYAQVVFAPKQEFDQVRQVCWDQNMTDLGSRKWTQLVVVGLDEFRSNEGRFDYVSPSVDDGPASLATPLSGDTFMLEVRSGSTVTRVGQTVEDADFRGFTTADKARRFTVCVTDLEDGTVRIEIERESSVETRIQQGSLPNGPARVIFQDDTYNAPKDPPRLDVPDPFTWHWDNIVIREAAQEPIVPQPQPQPQPVPPTGAGQFDSSVPARLVDTRSGGSTIDGRFAGIGMWASNSVTSVQVAGRGGVPVGAKAVSLNVTAVSPSGAGYLAVVPCGASTPGVSSVNYASNEVVANAVISELDSDGRICVHTQTSTEVVIDVTGHFPAGSDYRVAVARRYLDTRGGSPTFDSGGAVGRVRAGTVTEVVVGGRGEVPAAAGAVAVNLTAVHAAAPGFLTAFPCGVAVPRSSNVNYTSGDTVASAAIVRIGDDGKLCVYSLADVDLLVDVVGWFRNSDAFGSLTPARLVDTRGGLGATVDGQGGVRERVSAQSTLVVRVAGRGGVPSDAGAVALHVTTVHARDDGFLSVFPCGQSVPGTSTVNHRAGQVTGNLALARIGTSGNVCIYSLADTDIVVDVEGWFPR